ncbi:MAG: hypothetical protein M0R46_11365 [Candidatus Muirbacterium halophilum]|nr:hypothetical protein [Candidatus Muirbacterium halophilum]MCK9476512.1 hypothetical protein [Candidatus Muirbacterium halophilum]
MDKIELAKKLILDSINNKNNIIIHRKCKICSKVKKQSLPNNISAKINSDFYNFEKYDLELIKDKNKEKKAIIKMINDNETIRIFQQVPFFYKIVQTHPICIFLLIKF